MESPESNGSGNGNGSNRDAADATDGKLRELRGRAQEKANIFADLARRRLEAQRYRVAGGIEDAAGKLRRQSEVAGPIGARAGDQVAQRLEAAAGYIHERDTQDMLADFVRFVREHPLRAVAMAVLAGYVAGRIRG